MTTYADGTKIGNGLVAQQVTRVSMEQYYIRLLFEHGELMVGGDWRLSDASGSIVDELQKLDERKRFELWRVVSLTVTDCTFSELDLPTLSLSFGQGWLLQALSDDDGYEDWELTDLNGHVVCNGRHVTVFSPRQSPADVCGNLNL